MLDWLKEIFTGLHVDAGTQLALFITALFLVLAWQIVARAAAIQDRRVAGERTRLLAFYSPARDLLELRVHEQITEEDFRRSFKELLISHGGNRHLDDYESTEVIPVVKSFTTGNSFDPIKALAAFDAEVERLESNINLGPQPWDLMIQAGSWVLEMVVAVVSVAIALVAVASGMTYLIGRNPSPLFVIVGSFVSLVGAGGVYLAGLRIRKWVRQRNISKRAKELRASLGNDASSTTEVQSRVLKTIPEAAPKQTKRNRTK